jgi:hypothetical protein
MHEANVAAAHSKRRWQMHWYPCESCPACGVQYRAVIIVGTRRNFVHSRIPALPFPSSADVHAEIAYTPQKQMGSTALDT